MREYGIKLTELKDVKNADCIIFAVAHKEFKEMKLSDLDSLYAHVENKEKVLIDVKGLFDRKAIAEIGYTYWRL